MGGAYGAAIDWSAMLRIIASKHDFLRIPASKPTPTSDELCHLSNIISPRRSITGRLLWGTVLRRRDDGRWIYRKYTAGIDAAQHRGSARALIRNCKEAASGQRPH